MRHLHPFLIVILLLPGCANYQTNRFVVIDASVEGEGGFSPKSATELFEAIATRHGFEIERAVLNPSVSTEFQRLAKRGSSEEMRLVIRRRVAQFVFVNWGSTDDLKPTEAIADEIAEHLKSISVKFRRSTGREPLFWGP